jgi:hypothetical protein
MGCEIIEDRSGTVGVAGIQPTTAFGREIPVLAELLGFIFMFAHGGTAKHYFSIRRNSLFLQSWITPKRRTHPSAGTKPAGTPARPHG